MAAGARDAAHVDTQSCWCVRFLLEAMRSRKVDIGSRYVVSNFNGIIAFQSAERKRKSVAALKTAMAPRSQDWSLPICNDEHYRYETTF